MPRSLEADRAYHAERRARLRLERWGDDPVGAVRACDHCGAEMVAKSAKSRFCSRPCKARYGRLKYGDRYTVVSRSSSPRRFMTNLLNKKQRQGLPIDYLVEMYEAQGGRCAISGVPMTYQTGAGIVLTNTSIDRIDPDKGYEPGNVQLVCRVVNMMKFTMSTAELVNWCQSIIQTQAKH